jgi:DNA-binding XRE family transcriptional regulator
LKGRKVDVSKLNHLGLLRERAGKTRPDVHKATGVSLQFISVMETKGTGRKPSVELGKKLAALYGCSLEEIYKEVRSHEPSVSIPS